MRRPVALIIVALLCAACGGRVSPESDRPHGAIRRHDLPAPTRAVAAYRIELRRAVPDSVREKLEGLKGVATVASVARERFAVQGPKGLHKITVASTRPLRFRPIAPPSTRDADFVWTSLLGGRSVVSFDAARELELDDSGRIEIRGAPPIPIGAFATNGAPEIADVVVANHVGQSLGIGRDDLWIVGARSLAGIDDIRPRLVNMLSRYKVAIRRVVERAPASQEPAGEPQPVGHAEGTVIGAMSFRILKDGFIDPDPAWEAANIATGSVALLGEVTCHRLMFPQLHAAMSEIVRAGLAGEIDPSDYGGCYVPRFIDRDPDKPLSMHAFGLAFDLNVSDNLLGTRGDQHPKVVRILQKWGFLWGGTWARPDPMHFEMVRLIQP